MFYKNSIVNIIKISLFFHYFSQKTSERKKSIPTTFSLKKMQSRHIMAALRVLINKVYLTICTQRSRP